MSDTLKRLPVFPLGVVLLPRMPLPLHIFEERYRMMIGRCLDEDIPFGVLLHTGTTIQNVGCLASIDSVINRYDDGRLDILTVGTERFRIAEFDNSKPYLEASLEVFHDQTVDGGQYRELADLAASVIADLKRFADVVGYELDDEMLRRLDFEELSFLLATTDVFSIEERQQLLELRSTSDRMRHAARALEAGRERRTMVNRIREIIGDSSDDDIINLFN